GRVAISFHTHKKGISEKLSRTPGYFDKYVLGMKNMTELGLWFDINMTLTSLNLPYLSDTIDYIHDNFPQIIFITFNFVDAVGNAKKNPSIVPKISEIEYDLMKGLRKCINYNIHFHIERMPLCYLHGFETHSTETLKYLNGEYILISRKERNRDDTTHLPGSTLSYYTKTDSCKICFLTDFCAGLSENYSKIYGFDELYPRFKSIQKILSQKTNKKI
ncbi:MAG: hypothetical protein KAS30_02050, partial [Candidatus Diapherotrites archaeon]|nr:hypothetical protein [Candidatus Diapherotrites archaeon]